MGAFFFARLKTAFCSIRPSRMADAAKKAHVGAKGLDRRRRRKEAASRAASRQALFFSRPLQPGTQLDMVPRLLVTTLPELPTLTSEPGTEAVLLPVPVSPLGR
jgi:hypothetical protein